MKTAIIANPHAAGGRVARRWDRFARAVEEHLGAAATHRTSGPGQAGDLARRARDDGAERIVVVGGDGTLHEVAGGLVDLDAPGEGPLVVYLPSGTGGDFARSIGAAGVAPAELLGASSERAVDVGVIELTDHDGLPTRRPFVNIASCGASAVIAEQVNRTSKKLGPAGFALATLRGLSTWKDRRVRLRVDDRFDEVVDINSVAVGNGRCFGGGMRVCPEARLDDGLLDVTVIPSVSSFEFARHGRRIYKGTHLELERFRSARGAVVTVEVADDQGPPVPVETDGEFPGRLPLRCTVLPGALRVLAPWDRAPAVG